MAVVDLILRAGSGAAHNQIGLVLGGDTVAPVVINDAVVTARINLSAAVGLSYDNAVNRGLQSSMALAFDAVAAPAELVFAAAWRPALHARVEKRAVWQAARAAAIQVRPRWQASQSANLQINAPWQQAGKVAAGAAVRWQSTAVTPIENRAWWDMAKPIDTVAALAFDYAQFVNRNNRAVWDGVAKPANRVLTMPFDDKAQAQHLTRVAPWDTAKLVTSTGGAWAFVVPQNPQPYVQPRDTNLLLCCLQPKFSYNAVALLLGGDPCVVRGTDETATTAILPARVYMVVHNVFAQLLPSGANVPIFDATLSADVGSFAWSFSANGPQSLLTQLARTSALPVRIKLVIDGLEWVFLVETLRRTHSFGKHGVAITGRSVTALVGDPWTRAVAYNNSTAMTAQQIAAQALDLSDVALDWGITDWLVPTGAWSHSGTRLSAVQRVAEAAGGYLQSHRSLATLQVRHPYPLLPGGVPGGPWNWAGVTPDVVLAEDAVITSDKEEKDGPDVDAVYISGTNQGVIALVKRAGTAGAKLAAMQTDALITHVDAATQRGLSVLGTAGAKEHVTLELPVLTGVGQPGVIDVGKLVQVNESVPWRGRVRSVNVRYKRPSVRQTITLERHL